MSNFNYCSRMKMDIRYFIDELKRHHLFCVIRTPEIIAIVRVPSIGYRSWDIRNNRKVVVRTDLITSTPASDVGSLIESIKLEFLFS